MKAKDLPEAVKKSFFLLRTGRPSNSGYKQDNDLLPKGHPRSNK